MKSFAPEYATDPAKAIYRIYRDTRFSKDKTPYKDHIAASFFRAARVRTRRLAITAVSHKEVAMGGGVYMPESEALLAIRRHIAGHRRIPAADRPRALRNAFGGATGRAVIARAEGLPASIPRPTCCASSSSSFT